MRIAHVAPVIHPVPPSTYGGTERVIADLATAQTRDGHDVTLFGPADSTLPDVRQIGHYRSLAWHERQAGDAPPGLPAVLEAQLLHDLLARRIEGIETALEGLRLQYPGYAEELERRFIRRTALRLEEREYTLMREDGLFGAEVYTALMQELATRRTAAPSRNRSTSPPACCGASSSNL